MSAPALRPLSNGEILDGAFAIYRRQFVPFVVMTLIFIVPATILRVVAPQIGVFVTLVANMAIVGGAVYIAAEGAMGRSATVGAAATVGLKKFLPLLLNYIVFGFLLVLGLLLLIVPGIIVGIMGFAIAQVIVIENRGGGFGRSRELAKNAWGKISALWFMSWIITALPAIALTGGVVGVMAFKTQNDPGMVDRVTLWVDVIGAVLTCFTVPFSQAVLTLLYFDQRVRKEGYGIEMQAAALASEPPRAPSMG